MSIAFAICLVVILSLALIYINLDDEENDYPINDGLTSLIDFDVECPEVGSSTKGTIFVMQSEKSVKITITADLVVGETDIGGIEFAIAKELDVKNVLCSFGDDVSTKHVVMFKVPIATDPWESYIEIARARTPNYGGMPSGGGEGMVIIELQLKESVKLKDIDSLRIDVIVGGEDHVWGLVAEKISIPIQNINK